MYPSFIKNQTLDHQTSTADTLGHFFNVVIMLSLHLCTYKIQIIFDIALILPSKQHTFAITPRVCINMMRLYGRFYVWSTFSSHIQSTFYERNDDDNLDMCFVLWIYMSQVSSAEYKVVQCNIRRWYGSSRPCKWLRMNVIKYCKFLGISCVVRKAKWNEEQRKIKRNMIFRFILCVWANSVKVELN